MHVVARRNAAARVALIGVLAAACAGRTDAPIPPGYEDLVEGARTSLRQNQEGLIRPALSFVEVQCFAKGGRVVVFARSDSSDPRSTAWAIQGPGAPVDGWGGGFGADGMAEEIAFNFPGEPRVPCPPR